jgi:tetratricopeptide (TPR) repeat protein
MSLSLAVLTNKAIDASLKQKWDEAIELNLEILKIYPKNTDAKIRLGRCYIQKKEFSKAKKIFKEVLDVDPINSIALKNFELAKNQKTDSNTAGSQINTKSLLKEPGSSHEVLVNTSKSIKKEDFISGDELTFKKKKNEIELYKDKKGKKILVGSITDDYTVQRISGALSKNIDIKIIFIKWKGAEMGVLIKASAPIFKPDKIDIRPYLRKGTIEEPEMDMEPEEEETE